MKRFFCALTAFLLFFSLCACGADVPDNPVHVPADLAGKNIGVFLGSASAQYLSTYENEGGAELSYYTGGSAIMEDLESGVLDCIVIEKLAADELLPKSSKTETLDEPLLDTVYSIAVAKENITLTEDINIALASLAEDGTLQQIIEGYLCGGEYRYETKLDEEAVAGTVTLAVDAAFPPYEYYGESGKVEGLDLDIARAICDILGVGLEVSVCEPGTLLAEVQSGKVAFAMGRLTPSEEDLAKVDFTDPYLNITQQIIVRKK